MRTKLIDHVDAQIICINETHLKNNQTIAFDGYKFYSHNRQLTHINAPKGSGGVGILVHNNIYEEYEISVIDKSFEGILGILLTSKQTDYKIVIYSVYLPPENSPWGRNAMEFYSHLLGQIYLLSDNDAIFVCGDVNSRIGGLSDVINDIDGIPPRFSLDKVVNQHGHTFVDFLLDAKMCVLNGRFLHTSDNFTSVSSRGRAVVDYILVPHDCFNSCENFEVISPTSIINQHNLQYLLGERSKIPDHNFLRFDFKYSTFFEDTNDQRESNVSRIPFNTKVFKLKRIPANFLSSELTRRAFLDIIRNIELCRENQENVDKLYDDFFDKLIIEMDENIPSFDCSKKTRKPYWDDDLETLWHNFHMKEKAFLKFQGDRYMKNRLRNDFKNARNIFDKRLRSAERKYRRSLAIDVEHVSTENPKAFWDHIKNLGPKRKDSIPMEMMKMSFQMKILYFRNGQTSLNIPMEMMKMSFQMKILYFRNGQTSLNIFIMLKPMRISMTNFTMKFCLKKRF